MTGEQLVELAQAFLGGLICAGIIAVAVLIRGINRTLATIEAKLNEVQEQVDALGEGVNVLASDAARIQEQLYQQNHRGYSIGVTGPRPRDPTGTDDHLRRMYERARPEALTAWERLGTDDKDGV